MTAEENERFDAFCRVLVKKAWTQDQYRIAFNGYMIREHAEADHPGEIALVEDMGVKRLAEQEREAWLFGYRFRGSEALGGSGDGNAGSDRS